MFDDALLSYIGFEAGPALILSLLFLVEAHIMTA